MTLPKRSTWITLSLGFLISAIGIYLVIFNVDLDQLHYALSTAHYEWVALGTAVIAATIYTRTKRWQALLLPNQYSGSTLAAAMLIGQILNFLLPLRIGDVLRSFIASRSLELKFEHVLGSVAIEKAWDWITITIVIFIVTLASPLPDWFTVPARAVGLIALALIIFFIAIALTSVGTWRRSELSIRMLINRAIRWLPQRFRFDLIKRLYRLLDSLEVLRNRQSIWRAALWSAISWSLSIIVNITIMHAFGIDSLPAAMMLLCVMIIGTSLPPSIAALGVLEALAILTLGSFGVPKETALATGIVLHVIIILPAVAIAWLLIASNNTVKLNWLWKSGKP